MSGKILAPIVIFTYKRAEHTRRLLDSLAKCELAKESDIYIFSDGPKGLNDSSEVEEVRTVIHELKWKEAFKTITYSEAAVNQGLAKSIISGVTNVINEHGRVLVLEDDLVVAPSYIKYMNSALEAFEKDERVFSVTGWTYPISGLKHYKKDAWGYYRACSWGWGTWKDRWDKVEFDPKKAGFAKKIEDEAWCAKFTRGGLDLPGMLKLQLDGKIDSWAIRWNAISTDLDMITMYPKEPVISNRGLDGSGTHCAEADVKELGLSVGKDSYDFTDIELDNKLVKKAWRQCSDTLDKKIKRNLKTIFIDHKIPNAVKTRIKK